MYSVLPSVVKLVRLAKPIACLTRSNNVNLDHFVPNFSGLDRTYFLLSRQTIMQVDGKLKQEMLHLLTKCVNLNKYIPTKHHTNKLLTW